MYSAATGCRDKQTLEGMGGIADAAGGRREKRKDARARDTTDVVNRTVSSHTHMQYARISYRTLIASFQTASRRQCAATSSACAKSAQMSSMCSIPTETRIMSLVTPYAVCSSSVSCSCVVLDG